MKLFHETDVAIEPIDDRDDLERSISIHDEFYIPSSVKGIVKLIHDNAKTEYKIGDMVYFDPRMMIEIKELGLIIIDQKSVLMSCNG
jgi:hypothetical protein